jgi:trk system potassium uptake protein TrkH
MISRPYLSDYRLISYYTGIIIIGVALLMLIPLLTGLLCGEWIPALDFTIAVSLTFIVGSVFLLLGERTKDLRWLHGMVIAAFSWLIAMMLAAIPHYLSGHFISYLDCCFDVMSGFTTTGFTIIQDLDHVSDALNMWRHLLTFVGGQGMIVMVITFLVRGTAGAYMMYVGEGKDEKLLPNVLQTARAIWLISMVYLALGTAVLGFIAHQAGIRSLLRAFFHGMWIYMSAWSTGGFAPQSQNIMYYHSLSMDTVAMIIMILGSFNFILHYTVWVGKRSEIWKNIELVSFVTTVTATFSILTFALIKAGIYANALSIFRRGAFILISGHTGTGLQNIYAVQFIKDWGGLAMMAVTMAMAFGGSACSTCGGIKGLRMGILFKMFYHEIKRIILPENAVFHTKYHHIKDLELTDQTMKMVGLIIICFIALYFGGGLLGQFYGYPFVESLFESVSAGSTTGLSCGITLATMPAGLKIYYIFAMWAGRLEFLSVFGLLAFSISIFKGK